MSLTEGEKGRKPNHQGPIFNKEMITNEFLFGFNDDLVAILGLGASFIGTTSITPSEFIYGPDEFKGEFEDNLEAFAWVSVHRSCFHFSCQVWPSVRD